uniref:Putative GPI-anchored protein At4g28100 n=1 Tax=Anthurium amnicola TaxID=1678845 RepID=A0A1D1YRD6_9ARAE
MCPLPPLLLFFLLSFHFSIMPAQPDPVPVQPFSLPASSPPSTIPAFPEQSNIAGSCPLDLPDELFEGVSRACPSSGHLSRSRCCPSLAAWLYSAYSDTALAAAAKSPAPSRPSGMPVLPDDSEACVDGVEKALRARGLALGRLNDTCDVAYCYCGVRLRPFTCPGVLAVAKDAAGRWVAGDPDVRRIERDCALPGLAGCSRCLRSLYQLKEGGGGGGESGAKLGRERDCQLMGLTWLLARNRTLYLPAVTRVLRAFVLTPGGARPLSCTLAPDGMPLAVDSADLYDPDASSSPHLRRRFVPRSPLFLCLWWSLSLLLLLLHLS